MSWYVPFGSVLLIVIGSIPDSSSKSAMSMGPPRASGTSTMMGTPIWFIVYEYKRERYNLILDGATGAVIKGDIPTTKFGIF